MTEDVIKPGWELDVLVGRALGLEVYASVKAYFEARAPHAVYYDVNIEHPAFYDPEHKVSRVLPLYSTHTGEAMQLTEDWEYNWNLMRDVGKSGSFETAGRGYGLILSYPGMQMWPIWGETAAHVICLGVLKIAELAER